MPRSESFLLDSWICIRVLIPSLASIYPSNLYIYIPVDVRFVRFRNRVSFQILYFKFSFPFLPQQRPSNSDQSQRYVTVSNLPYKLINLSSWELNFQAVFKRTFPYDGLGFDSLWKIRANKRFLFVQNPPCSFLPFLRKEKFVRKCE